MKKLTPRRLNWLDNRARREERNRQRKRKKNRNPNSHTLPFRRDGTRPVYVDAWWGDDRQEQILCVGGKLSPPSTICFDESCVDTLRFLEHVSSSLKIKKDEDLGLGLRKWAFQPPGKGLRRLTNYWDFAGIECFETAPAVVFAAEYDRARRLMQETPPTVNLHKWSDAAFRSLHELGFFEIVGLTEQTKERYVDIEQNDTRLMRLISGSNADELEETSLAVVELSRFIDDNAPLSDDLEVSFTTALGEAMANVSSHAYPNDYDPDHMHVGRWWVAASANRATRCLDVVAYDQGATIPGTLPQRSFFTKVLSWVKLRDLLVSPTEINNRDPDFIEFAMRFGNSRTGAPGRGQGLPQMCELVDKLRDGRLDILSRNGRCSYTPTGRYELSYLPHAIDGTLIKWVMRIPEP